MDSSTRMHVSLRMMFGVVSSFSVLTALAQEPPSEPPPAVHITQAPQQIVPTGQEDAPPRAEDFASRSARTTGQSPEEKLRVMTSESAEGLETVRRSNGAIGLDLQGRFMNVVVGKQREDGTFELSCHTGDEAVTQSHHAADILAGRAAKVKLPPLPPVKVTQQPPVLEEK
jgi:hypothetical protein